MKVCERCGEEIWTKDGDNLCAACEGREALRRASVARRKREAILRDLGLVKVRGALGGVYWE